MIVKNALDWARNILRKNKVSEPEKSAEFLLRQVLNWDKAKLLTNPDYELTEKLEIKFRGFIERRKKHEPVWYITGRIEFYGLDLEVNENVLIPRPETEFLVEEVLKYVVGKNGLKILELGAGSGAISLALASTLKTKIFASDISKEALGVAKKNAKRLGLDSRLRGNDNRGSIEFRQGDLFDPWEGEKFDIIVANLPYIPHEDMSSLALDIYHFEPRIALDGGRDGLEIYEKLLAQVEGHLNENATMFFEIGIDQGEKIQELTKKYLHNTKVKIIKDYSDIDRIAVIKLKQ